MFNVSAPTFHLPNGSWLDGAFFLFLPRCSSYLYLVIAKSKGKVKELFLIMITEDGDYPRLS